MEHQNSCPSCQASVRSQNASIPVLASRQSTRCEYSTCHHSTRQNRSFSGHCAKSAEENHQTCFDRCGFDQLFASTANASFCRRLRSPSSLRCALRTASAGVCDRAHPCFLSAVRCCPRPCQLHSHTTTSATALAQLTWWVSVRTHLETPNNFAGALPSSGQSGWGSQTQPS